MGLAMTPQTKPITDDVRIEIKELVPPAHVFREYPVSSRAAQTTYAARQAIHRILHGADDRLLVVIGPVPRLRSRHGIRQEARQGGPKMPRPTWSS